MPPNELRESVFLKACRCEKTAYTPIWLIRQAGPHLKEYRAIREKVPFLELCKNKDLVTQVTVMAQEKLDTDAAIIFSDILLLLEPLGFGLKFEKGEAPLVTHLVRSIKDLEELREIEPAESLSFVIDAIRQTRAALKPNVPLIGYAGGPFTLSSYIIEGGPAKGFRATKELMHQDPSAWGALMGTISRATIKYLNAQIEAGAQAVGLFDHWVGCLNPEEYEKFVLPYSQQVIRSLKSETPVIHYATRTDGILELFSQAGGDVIGVDHRVRLDEAWHRIGVRKAIQGNLDPMILCSDIENIKTHVKTILDMAAGRPGHIFNLGQGMLPETPLENIKALIEMVRGLSLEW